jgi:D-lactate dehydrogenase
MKIYFTETEPAERLKFASELEEHEVYIADDLEEVEADAEILSTFIYSLIDEAFLEAHPALKLVAIRSTTADHIDLQSCGRRGVTVCNISSYGDYTVAEHTFALILALARRLQEVTHACKMHLFSYESLRCFELHGKTLGIVGTGRVGLETIRLAKAFGMRILAYDVHPRMELAELMGFRYVPLEDLLRNSHIISLHAALNPASFHMIDRAALSKCKPGAFLINTSRGGLVDTKALLEALDAGIIAGAGLDVLEDETVIRRDSSDIISDQIIRHMQGSATSSKAKPQELSRVKELQDLIHNERLLAHKGVVFTPHIAFNSAEAVDRIRRMTLENIRSFIQGNPINVLHP